MSDEKIVEATGRGRLHLENLKALTSGAVQPSISKIRIVKKRDGEVYEDRVIEYVTNGVNR